MKRMTAKYGGTCKGCAGQIEVGSAITWEKGTGAWHRNCEPSGDPVADAEYCKGVAEGNLRTAERAIYGDELTEQFDLDREWMEYNRGA